MLKSKWIVVSLSLVSCVVLVGLNDKVSGSESSQSSKLDQSEIEIASSQMIDECNKWLSVRSITANFEVSEKYFDYPGISNGTPHTNKITGKLNAEITFLKTPVNNRHLKLRLLIECKSEEYHIMFLDENAYDNSRPPVIWYTSGKPMHYSNISHFTSAVYPYGGIPWQRMFHMSRMMSELYMISQESGTPSDTLAHYVIKSFVPYRVTTQQEDQEHFSGRKQYEFCPTAPRGLTSPKHFADADSGKLTMLEEDPKFGLDNIGARVTYGQYITYEDASAHFASEISIHAYKEDGTNVYLNKTQLSNVVINGPVSSSDFIAKPWAVPMHSRESALDVKL